MGGAKAPTIDSKGSRVYVALLMTGVFGAALFYGDSVITPAISVLSAIEGLEVATPPLKADVVPLTIIELSFFTTNPKLASSSR